MGPAPARARTLGLCALFPRRCDTKKGRRRRRGDAHASAQRLSTLATGFWGQPSATWETTSDLRREFGSGPTEPLNYPTHRDSHRERERLRTYKYPGLRDRPAPVPFPIVTFCTTCKEILSFCRATSAMSVGQMWSAPRRDSRDVSGAGKTSWVPGGVFLQGYVCLLKLPPLRPY